MGKRGGAPCSAAAALAAAEIPAGQPRPGGERPRAGPGALARAGEGQHGQQPPGAAAPPAGEPGAPRAGRTGGFGAVLRWADLPQPGHPRPDRHGAVHCPAAAGGGAAHRGSRGACPVRPGAGAVPGGLFGAHRPRPLAGRLPGPICPTVPHPGLAYPAPDGCGGGRRPAGAALPQGGLGRPWGQCPARRTHPLPGPVPAAGGADPARGPAEAEPGKGAKLPQRSTGPQAPIRTTERNHTL